MMRRLFFNGSAVVHVALLAVASGARAEPTGTAYALQGTPTQHGLLFNDTVRRLAVAWNDSTNGSGVLRAMSVRPPWEFQTPPLETGSDSILRFADGRLYVVSRVESTIAVISTDTWTTLQVHSLVAGSEPLDIAVVSPQRAYVTRRTATHLLRLDLATGTSEEVVDLGVFADADGVPDMGMMAVHEGRLFVQIRRLNLADPGQFAPPAYIAVVDIASEQLIDVDPVTEGVQAIELQGTAPKLKMQVVLQTRRLFVSATGDFFDEGGIEMIDLDTLQSVGLVVRESDGMVGADLGAFVMVTPDYGYLVFSTDFALSSHLKPFSVPGGPGLEFYNTVSYFAPTLEFDPQTNTFFFPVGGSGGEGVHVFDAVTGMRLTPEPIPTSGRPTDLALLADVVIAVPTASAWGLAVMTLLLLVGGTVILVRRCR